MSGIQRFMVLGIDLCDFDPATDGELRDEQVLVVFSSDLDRLTAERDALQERLNAADQRNDTGTSLIQRMVANFDTEIRYYDDVEPNDLEHDLVLSEMREFLNPKDDDWHMNPCKQGHRDVGAAGGMAACNQCDEKIEAATTQEAFERWNETHPAIESA